MLQILRMGGMVCDTCGGKSFAEAVYTHELGQAPAAECLRCHALCLDESAAKTPEERESVKLAIAMRGSRGRLDPRVAREPCLPVGRVLLVDDDPSTLALYESVLRRAAWQVDVVASGSAAVERFGQADFDVVISDVQMPDMSGLDLLRTLREQGSEVPVILTTARPDVESAATAVEYGAFRYLVKSSDLASLLDAVARGARLRRLSRCSVGAWEKTSAMYPRSLNELAVVALEEKFDRAMQSVYMAYQPIVSCQSRSVYGYEALVRSADPEMRSPAHLFGVAERLGRLHELGRVIRSQVATGAAHAPADALLFVNVHPEDLTDFELLSPSAPLSGLAPRVVLEITERASLDHVEELPGRLSRLRNLGYRLAIDDLGAGYAGLSCLPRIEPDVVKLDMSLVRGVDASTRQRTLVQSVLELAGGDLDMIVICEGVETVSEYETLGRLGCNWMQGYLFAKPARDFVEPAWPVSTPTSRGSRDRG